MRALGSCSKQKEKTNPQEKTLTKTEISNLIYKGFTVIVIKVLTDLGEEWMDTVITSETYKIQESNKQRL